MKTKIFILLMILILAFSCSKNNPVSASGSDTGIESGGTDTGTEEGSGGEDTGTGTGEGTGEGDTGGTDIGETTIGIYAGTYTGKAVKTKINNITEEEKVVEDVTLVVNKNSTAIFKTASLGDYTFEKFETIFILFLICLKVFSLIFKEIKEVLLSDNKIAKSPSSLSGNLFTTYSSIPAYFKILSHIGVVTILIVNNIIQ